MRASSAAMGSVVGRYQWFVGLTLLLFGLSGLSPQSVLAQTPPPQGNWLISITYSGNASTTTTPQPPAVSSASIVSNGSSSALSADPSLDLSVLANQPPQTYSGGISARVQAWTDRVQSQGSGETSQNGGAPSPSP